MVEAAGVELDGRFKTGLFCEFPGKSKSSKPQKHQNACVQVQNRYTTVSDQEPPSPLRPNLTRTLAKLEAALCLGF